MVINKKMTIGFVLFENYHQRKNTGSSRIRGHWIIKYLNGIDGVKAETFQQGKTYDVVVFQKVYWKEFAKLYDGIKILDICDPDWLDGADVIAMSKLVDVITCPTLKLKKELAQMVKCPVIILRDMVDLEGLPEPKKHSGQAKKVVWFGYSHNSDVLDVATHKLGKMGLTLKIISDGNYMTSDCKVEYVKWDAETVNAEIQDADFALLPEYNYGRFPYKSNNKTIQSWALGLPVAKSVEDLEKFVDPIERQKEADLRYKEVIEDYDVRLGAIQLKAIIDYIMFEKYGTEKRENI